LLLSVIFLFGATQRLRHRIPIIFGDYMCLKQNKRPPWKKKNRKTDGNQKKKKV